MGTLLKELNAEGALTADKRHTFLLLLLEPLQAWWSCLFGWRWHLRHWCCLGAGKEPRASALPAERALFSSVAFSCCRLPVQREGWQDRTRSCEGRWAALGSWVWCWLTPAGSLKGFCWGLGCAGRAPVAPAGGLTKQAFLGSVLRGGLRGKEAGRTFWGSISASCVLLEMSADWRGLMGRCWATSTSRLAWQGYCCVFLCRQGYTKRTERVDEGPNQLYFHSIKINSKTHSLPPPTDFSIHTCFLTRHLMVVYLIC